MVFLTSPSVSDGENSSASLIKESGGEAKEAAGVAELVGTGCIAVALADSIFCPGDSWAVRSEIFVLDAAWTGPLGRLDEDSRS